MYIRKTVDNYEVQGYYYGQWERLTTEETLKAAKETLKDYNDNEINIAHRIKKVRTWKQ